MSETSRDNEPNGILISQPLGLLGDGVKEASGRSQHLQAFLHTAC